jgi:hypothetical protein
MFRRTLLAWLPSAVAGLFVPREERHAAADPAPERRGFFRCRDGAWLNLAFVERAAPLRPGHDLYNPNVPRLLLKMHGACNYDDSTILEGSEAERVLRHFRGQPDDIATSLARNGRP